MDQDDIVDVRKGPIAASRDGELVYVHDGMPGWRRIRRGRAFAYVDADGRPLRDAATLRRIRALAIPPAYGQVWICPLPNGHVQATARDARGRKQYRYHPHWQALQGQLKFERLRAFGRALPALRGRVQRDLDQPGLARAKVLAAVVRLLDTTYARVGNHEYARRNGSYGLTTLRDRHARVAAGVLELRFRGKSGVQHHATVHDPALARIVRRCQELPGQALFQYLGDDGAPHAIGSTDVNDYLREAAAGDFTAKDFRTWHASAMALERLAHCETPSCRRDAQRTINAVLREVAQRLGHTLAVCRKAYVHAAVLERWAQAALPARAPRRAGLKAHEGRLLALLDSAAPGSAPDSDGTRRRRNGFAPRRASPAQRPALG